MEDSAGTYARLPTNPWKWHSFNADDNALFGAIIILVVVLYNVGGVYKAGNLWGWFWIVDDPATITWVGIIGIVLDVIVMPNIFFISGNLTPASLESKTGWRFLAETPDLHFRWWEPG